MFCCNQFQSGSFAVVLTAALHTILFTSCDPGNQNDKVAVIQPESAVPIAVFAAAGIQPDWKISLHMNSDSTFHASLTLQGHQKPFAGRVIPYTTFPAGADRPNDIYSGNVTQDAEIRSLLIRILPDQCGGKQFSGLPNAGCEVMVGSDTLRGCGRWLNRHGL